MKKLLTLLTLAGVVAFGTATASAQNTRSSEAAPKTLMHVITVEWKEGTTDEQIKAALDGAHKLAADFDGLKRVWTRTVKAQGEKTHAIVMEFENEAALKEYAGSDAQKAWYKVYIPIREASTTFDISN